MKTAEALNILDIAARKHGFNDWLHAGFLREPAELTHIIVDAMEEYARQFKTVEPYRLERPVEDGVAGTELGAVEPEKEQHPVLQWAQDQMLKQDQNDGVVFNGKQCQVDCNCVEVQEYHHGNESLKRGYQCLAHVSNDLKQKS